jgi:hypothetical protein
MTACPEKSKDCERTEIQEGLPRSFVERVYEFLERYADDPAQSTRNGPMESRERQL